MEMNEYQKAAMSTRMESCNNPLYMLMEICSEAGELQGKFAKAIRKGKIVFDGHNDFAVYMSGDEYEEWLTDVMHEVGDVLWGLAGIADIFGLSLEDVAKMNIEKLASRKVRGVIEGNGDNR